MKRSVWISFLIAEAALYTAFMALDLFELRSTAAIKYAAILLIAVVGLWQAHDRDSETVTAALCLTAVADLFLLVLDRRYAVGICLFLLVQFLYAMRMDPGRQTIYRFAAAIPAAMVLSAWLDTTSALAAVYILLFFINLLRAGVMLQKEKTRKQLLFFLGLALFFCCDLCVGVYNTGSGALWAFSRVAMWGFYLPGQVLILASAHSFEGAKS